MRGLFRSADGTVSVFLIIAVAALFALMGLFIDYARILAANRKAEEALKTAVRSVLSSYDRELQQTYGIFGYGTDDSDAIYRKVLAARLGGLSDADGFKLLDASLDSHSLTFEREIGRHAIFKRQIMEEMKYRAPIDFTIELAGRLKGIAGRMKEASHAAQTLAGLQPLYVRRGELIRQAVALQLSARERAGNSGMAGLAEEAASGEHGALTARISELRSLAGRLRSGLAESSEPHRAELTQAIQALHQAREYNMQIRQLLDRSHTHPRAGGYDRAAGDPVLRTFPVDAAPEEEPGSWLAQAESLWIKDDFFDGFIRELNEQQSAWETVKQQGEQYASRLESVISAAEAQSEDEAAMPEGGNQLRSAYLTYHSRYIEPGTVILDRHKLVQRMSAGDAELEREQEAARTRWAEARQMLHSLDEWMKQAEAGAAEFRKLAVLYEENMRRNGETAQEARSGSLSEDPAEAASAAMSLMDGLFAGLGDLLGSYAERVYVNEFAANRFSRFEPEQVRRLMSGDRDGSLNNALSVRAQETEYILYGFAHPGKNIAAAYGQVLLMRLAVRTMEGFAEARAAAHPLLLLAKAVTHGATAAMQDMRSLLETGEVELAKSIPVRLTYRDHLRLFLLLQGREEQTLARMLALIQYHTGRDPFAVPTYVIGEAEVSIRLWFLPGLVRLLNSAGLLDGAVEAGRYVMNKTAAYSY